MSALKPIHCFVFLPMLYSEVLLSSDQGFPLSLDKADSKNESVSGMGLSNSFFSLGSRSPLEIFFFLAPGSRAPGGSLCTCEIENPSSRGYQGLYTKDRGVFSKEKER